MMAASMSSRLLTSCKKTSGLQQLRNAVFQPQLPNLFFIKQRSTKCSEVHKDRWQHSAVIAGCSSYHTSSCHRHRRHRPACIMQNAKSNKLFSLIIRSDFHKTLTFVPVRKISQQPQDSEPNQKVVKKIILFRNPINIIRDRLYSWLIRVYFDPDFYLNDFAQGAKQAVFFVSHQLSQGAFEKLDGLLSHNVLADMKDRYSKMSEEERKDLAIGADDVISYPYDIGVHYDAEGVTKIIKVKIQMKFLWGYVLVPSKQLVQQNERLQCDYEFHRDFSPDVDPEWTITGINYSSFDQQNNSDKLI